MKGHNKGMNNPQKEHKGGDEHLKNKQKKKVTSQRSAAKREEDKTSKDKNAI